MKKLLLVCCMLVGISAASHAQGRQPQTAEQRVERLKAAVTGITDDQSAKLTAIYAVSAKSQDSLRTALNGDFSAMRDKMAPITATTNAKIKTVLTADQAKQFDAMPQGRRGGGGGGNN